jgi:hypothetical protein
MNSLGTHGNRPFNTGVYPAVDLTAGPLNTNSHVVYADYAGEAVGPVAVEWSAVANRPSALAGMTDGNTFHEALTFDEALTFSSVIAINANATMPYLGRITWGGNQYIEGLANGQFNFVSGAGYGFNGPVFLTQSYAPAGYNLVSTGRFTFPGGSLTGTLTCNGTAKISDLPLPVDGGDAVNLDYLNNKLNTVATYMAYVTIDGGGNYVIGYRSDAGITVVGQADGSGGISAVTFPTTVSYVAVTLCGVDTYMQDFSFSGAMANASAGPATTFTIKTLAAYIGSTYLLVAQSYYIIGYK